MFGGKTEKKGFDVKFVGNQMDGLEKHSSPKHVVTTQQSIQMKYNCIAAYSTT